MTTCEAAIPIGSLGIVDIWEICGLPAEARHRYTCPCWHERERSTCRVHQPGPDQVGCRQCYEAGHECPMTAELLASTR